MRSQGARFAHQAEAVRSRHADVGHHQRMPDAAEFFQSLARAPGRIHPPVAPEEMRFERAAHPGLIVDHQHSIHGFAPGGGFFCRVAPARSSPSGNISVKLAPAPARFPAARRPPCCSTILRHTAKPSPGLPACVLNPASNIFVPSPLITPGPVSLTEITATALSPS